jgi:hypothetical protein
MNILFIHQNFPGQFKFLAPALVAQGHSLRAVCWMDQRLQKWNVPMRNFCKKILSMPKGNLSKNIKL